MTSHNAEPTTQNKYLPHLSYFPRARLVHVELLLCVATNKNVSFFLDVIGEKNLLDSISARLLSVAIRLREDFFVKKWKVCNANIPISFFDIVVSCTLLEFNKGSVLSIQKFNRFYDNIFFFFGIWTLACVSCFHMIYELN